MHIHFRKLQLERVSHNASTGNMGSDECFHYLWAEAMMSAEQYGASASMEKDLRWMALITCLCRRNGMVQGVSCSEPFLCLCSSMAMWPMKAQEPSLSYFTCGSSPTLCSMSICQWLWQRHRCVLVLPESWWQSGRMGTKNLSSQMKTLTRSQVGDSGKTQKNWQGSLTVVKTHKERRVSASAEPKFHQGLLWETRLMACSREQEVKNMNEGAHSPMPGNGPKHHFFKRAGSSGFTLLCCCPS